MFPGNVAPTTRWLRNSNQRCGRNVGTFAKMMSGCMLSAADVLNPTLSAELGAKLSLVLAGTSAAGLLDIRTTALGERVPGVSIHAQLLEQILTDQYLTRSDVTAFVELLSFVSLD